MIPMPKEIDTSGWERQCAAFIFGPAVIVTAMEIEICKQAARFAINRVSEETARVRVEVRDEIINHPEVNDFLRGVVTESQHARDRWVDEGKRDFDWHAVATYLAAKALVNPPQNDGTTGIEARLHRIVALGALAYNWHAAVKARDGN